MLLENYHRLDLDVCVRRLVTKNGEFESSEQIFDAKELMCEGFVLGGVDYKLLELYDQKSIVYSLVFGISIDFFEALKYLQAL